MAWLGDPHYFQDPHPIKTGNPWGMKNVNNIVQDKWEYTEDNYYTKEGISKRADDFAEALEASLKSRGLYQDPRIWLENKIRKTEEEIELYEAIQAEYLASKRIYEAGDGSRWEDL